MNGQIGFSVVKSSEICLVETVFVIGDSGFAFAGENSVAEPELRLELEAALPKAELPNTLAPLLAGCPIVCCRGCSNVHRAPLLQRPCAKYLHTTMSGLSA